MIDVINEPKLLGIQVKMYAHYDKERQSYDHIFPSKIQLRMCGVREPVSILLEVSDEGTYYGWFDNEESDISMVYKSLLAVNICFPYGVKAAIDNGRGHLVKLTVIKIVEE